MPTYAYSAVDATGREVAGYIKADSPEAVEERLISLEMYPLSIQESRPKRGVPLPFFRRGVSLRLLIDFTSSLSTVIGSGMPLLEGLKAISEQLKNPVFAGVIDDIVRAVSAGESLARSLSYHTEVFPEFYTNVVKAGEEGGKLQMVLDDLTRLLENQEEIRSRIKEAMMYPAVVLTLLAGLIFIFLSFVLPKLFVVIQDIGAPIPPLTRATIAVSSFFQHYWYIILITVFFLPILYRMLMRYPPTRFFLDGLKLQMVIIGPVLWMISIARFSRYLAIFSRAGILVTQSLAMTSKVIGNSVIERDVLEIRERVIEGGLLSKAFEKSNFLPPMTVLMTRVGEESGELEKMLDYVADYYEREANKAIKRALALLEPMLILLVAVIVGMALASVILPIYSLYNYIK